MSYRTDTLLYRYIVTFEQQLFALEVFVPSTRTVVTAVVYDVGT
jgi:hypothetical protein